jgi:bifunctional oligoribonuclease and PAP phosphatase NrnA
MTPTPDPIAPARWRAAAQAIRELGRAGTVVVSGHVNPDGDALGSALALHLALTRSGPGAPRSVIGFSEPFAVAPNYRFLPGLDQIVPAARVPLDADLFVVFDTGAQDRLGTLRPAFLGARRRMVVDHHASNTTSFADIDLIDPTAPASVVLCRRLLAELGLPLDADIATCLYTGLITDTGRFQYQATRPSTHLLAAELLEAGVDQYEVAKAVFETNDFGYLRLLGATLDRATQVPEASLVWTAVTVPDQERFGVGLEQTEGVIDVIRTDAASEVAAVLKEQPDGSGWKVSLRSKGGVNVGEVAAAFGGGGHAYAAGYSSALGLEATVKALIDALPPARR